MLESLNAVDVQELQDTHREANEMRASINQMIADIAQMRDERIDTLYYTIWHQSTVNQCTASAVQFLLERLQCDSVQDKDELLLLLAYVARGNSYASIEHDTGELNAAEQGDLSEQEREWRQMAHIAVVAGIPTYLDLLEHEESSVRIAAAYILGSFKEHACHIFPRIISSIQSEEDDLARSSMLLCLGALGELPKCGQLLLTKITQEQASPLARLAAAMALAWLAKDNIPVEAVHVLVETIVEPELTEDLYNELPWAKADVAGDTCQILYALGSRSASIAIPMLIDALESSNFHSSLRVVDALLHLAFNGRPSEADLTAQALTGEQRLVLCTIANSNCAWVIDILNIGKVS